jgi:hypothetical protein
MKDGEITGGVTLGGQAVGILKLSMPPLFTCTVRVNVFSSVLLYGVQYVRVSLY